jgi:molecular chaperone Hsp33
MNKIHGFHFEDKFVRGEWIRLEMPSEWPLPYADSLTSHLGELSILAALFAHTLKNESQFQLQAKGTGPLKLLVVEASHEMHLRATASWHFPPPNTPMKPKELLGQDALFSLSIVPNNGQSYTSLVALDASTWPAMLEQYFQQSEQLPTRFWIAQDNNTYTGLMLQYMPPPELSDIMDDPSIPWQETLMLAQTLTDIELNTLPPEELLMRLFSESTIRLHPAQNILFQCRCSQEKTEFALRVLGTQELEKIISEGKNCTIVCHFCQKGYNISLSNIQDIYQSLIQPH